MTMRETKTAQHPVPLAVALALLLSLAGCAAGATQGSFASHGVDYIPAFDTPYSGGGGRG